MLYNGDYLQVLKNNTIECDLIITDPPYLYEKGGNSKLFDCKPLKRKNRTMLNSEFGEIQIYDFLNHTSTIMNNPQWYVFCSEKQLPFYLKWAVDNKYLFNVLVWKKPLSILNRKRFSTNLEYIVRIYKWGSVFNILTEDKNYCYDKCKQYNQIRGKNKLHPQQKPIELLSELIWLSSNENDTILDPFMGSGSTGVACLNTNRKFIGIELDNTYFEIAKKRIEEANIIS